MKAATEYWRSGYPNIGVIQPPSLIASTICSEDRPPVYILTS